MPLYSTVFGFAVAVMVVIPDVPPSFKTALVPWVSPPVPDSAVETTNPPEAVMLLVRVTVVTVAFGIVKEFPETACALVLKV